MEGNLKDHINTVFHQGIKLANTDELVKLKAIMQENFALQMRMIEDELISREHIEDHRKPPDGGIVH